MTYICVSEVGHHRFRHCRLSGTKQTPKPILLYCHLGTYLKSIHYYTLYSQENYLKISSAQYCPFCLVLHVSKVRGLTQWYDITMTMSLHRTSERTFKKVSVSRYFLYQNSSIYIPPNKVTTYIYLYCRLPSYIYNIVYNDRDPIDAVAITKYIHDRKEKVKAVCNKKKEKKVPQDKL